MDLDLDHQQAAPAVRMKHLEPSHATRRRGFATTAGLTRCPAPEWLRSCLRQRCRRTGWEPTARTSARGPAAPVQAAVAGRSSPGTASGRAEGHVRGHSKGHRSGQESRYNRV